MAKGKGKGKKKKKSVPEPEPEPEPVKHPKWWEWVEKNSKPKKLKIVRPPPEPATPWQKRGPMKKKDWKRFYRWAEKNARPLELDLTPPPIPCEPGLPCSKKKEENADDDVDPEEAEKKLEELSKPLKRFRRKKYEIPSKDFPYTPVIVWGQTAQREKSRPVKMPPRPPCFVNEEVSLNLWYDYRFPVSPAAQNARPSARIVTLAKPRVTPPFPPHCPIPDKVIERPWWDYPPPPPRKKFTPKGWKIHQRRLLYLAQPVVRPGPNDYFYM